MASSRSGSATSELEHEQLIDLCRRLSTTTDADRVFLWMYDEGRGIVRLCACNSEDVPVGHGSRWARRRLEKLPVLEKAIREQRTLEIPDASSDPLIPEEMAADLGLRSLRVEPLDAEGPVGVLCIEPASTALPSEARSLIAALGRIVRDTNARIEDHHQRATINLLLELVSASAETGRPDHLLHEICVRLARHLGTRRTSIFLRERETGRFRPRMAGYAEGTQEPGRYERFRALEAPAGLDLVYKGGEPVIVGRRTIDPEWADTFDVGAVLLIPFHREPDVAGVLSIDAPTGWWFTEDQVQIASAVAEHIAALIERAEITAARDLELRASAAIRRLLEEGTEATSIEDAAGVLARVAHEVLEPEQTVAYIIDTERRISHIAPMGVPDEFVPVLEEMFGGVHAADLAIGQLVLEHATPIFVDDTEKSDLLPRDVYEPLHLRAYALLPLLTATGPLGAVVCSHTRNTRIWSHRDQHIGTQLALEGTLVVQNAVFRRAERERLEALTEEVDRLAEVDRLRRALLANVSHELRTPLTIIKGAGRTLLDHLDSLEEDKKRALLVRLDVNASDLERVVERLLDFSRLQEGRLEVHPQRLQLDALLRSVAARLADVLSAHDFEVEVDESLWVEADPTLLERVVEGLLENAAHHTPKGTSVRLEARRHGIGEAHIAVVDDGPGIAPRDLQHLGEAFFRAGDIDRQETRGLGLNLALVRQILRLHGSTLEVHSTPGQGARFAFRLRGSA